MIDDRPTRAARFAARRAHLWRALLGCALAAMVAVPALAQTQQQRAQIPQTDPRTGGRLDQIFPEAPVPPPTTPAASLEVQQPPPEPAADSAGSTPLHIQSASLGRMTADFA